MNLMEAIEAYIKRFGEGPPTIGYTEEEAVALIEEALKKGEPLKEGAETRLPKGAIL